MMSKVQSAAGYWTIDIKMTSKVQPAADYWTIDRENLGTRLCHSTKREMAVSRVYKFARAKKIFWIYLDNTLLDLQNSSYPTQPQSIIAEYIDAVFLKLNGTITVHHKRNKMTPLVLLPWKQFCRWWWVNKNKNSQFCRKTKTIYPTQVNDGSEDINGNYVCFK